MNAGMRDDRGMGFEHARIPPQSIEAEQAVLGGLMLGLSPQRAQNAFDEVSGLVDESSFYRRDHQLIFRALTHLSRKKRPMDAVTVGEFLQAKGFADAVDGGSYLIELASTTPSAANIKAYAEIVREKAILRKLIEVGTEIANDGFNPEGRDTIELVGNAQTRIGSLLQSEPCELEEIGPVLNRMFTNLQHRYELNGALDGLSTGLTDLDKVLNGLKGGRMYVIAARPKQGKTSLALNIAEDISVRHGKPVSVFSFEMSQEDLTERLTCSVGKIDHQRFRTGQLEDEDWSRITEAVRTLKSAPIRIAPPKNVRVESLVAQARRLHARTPQALFVVDYLQLLDTKGAENRNKGISEVSRQLKMLAIDLDVPIIVLSQLNRDLEKRTDKRPMMSDLRDSGAIEQDADAILFVYRDESYNPASPHKGTAEIIVGAQRNGPTDTVRVASRLHHFRFDDLSPDWEPGPSEPEQSRYGKSKFGRNGRDAAAGGA